jgi:N-acetylmuramoyl-L-alanine amidase
VPVVGGGTRSIDPVPWGYAQLPRASSSVALAAVVERHLRERGVSMHDPALPLAPLRLLAGVNMPAVLIEMGFLTNEDDLKALSSDQAQSALAEALLAAIIEVRAGVPSGTGGPSGGGR